MKKITATALSAAALCLLASPAIAQEREPSRAEIRGQEELARLLEGRVAGEPESCITTFQNRGFERIDRTALVYRDGDTIWVNTTRDPRSIDDNDIMVIDRFSPSRLCRTDQITLRDNASLFFSGILMLDDFVPYRKVGG